jgi:hypothetical protein
LLQSDDTILLNDVVESSSLSKDNRRCCCCVIVDEDIEEEGDGLRGKLSGLNGGAYRTLSWRNSVSSNVVGSILMKDVDSRSWYDFPDNIAFSFSNL